MMVCRGELVEVHPAGDPASIPHVLMMPGGTFSLEERSHFLAEKVEDLQARVGSNGELVGNGGGGIKRVRVILKKLEPVRRSDDDPDLFDPQLTRPSCCGKAQGVFGVDWSGLIDGEREKRGRLFPTFHLSDIEFFGSEAKPRGSLLCFHFESGYRVGGRICDGEFERVPR